MFMERDLYYCNQGEYIALNREGMSQPSLNAATFHPTIQAKPPKSDGMPPKGLYFTSQRMIGIT